MVRKHRQLMLTAINCTDCHPVSFCSPIRKSAHCLQPTCNIRHCSKFRQYRNILIMLQHNLRKLASYNNRHNMQASNRIARRHRGRVRREAMPARGQFNKQKLLRKKRALSFLSQMRAVPPSRHRPWYHKTADSFSWDQNISGLWSGHNRLPVSPADLFSKPATHQTRSRKFQCRNSII